MNLLLDTHAFLWWITDDSRLSATARAAIAAADRAVYVSAASCWEIAINSGLGRLAFAGDPGGVVAKAMASNRFYELPVSHAHAFGLLQLPLLHRDPFDRILIAQAQLERLSLVTDDAVIRNYNVDILW